VSIFQAATQINERPCPSFPSWSAFSWPGGGGPWMLSVMLDYMREVFTAYRLVG
jgi:flagellar biosynthetic protein FliQ